MIDTKQEKEGFFPRSVTRKECVDTGMALVLVALIGLSITGGRPWLVAAVAFLVINMTVPALYALPARLWFGLSRAMATVMSKVILSIVFFVVVTPLALLRRAFGHDPMRFRQWKRGTDSVFVVRDHSYTPKEIERPY